MKKTNKKPCIFITVCVLEKNAQYVVVSYSAELELAERTRLDGNTNTTDVTQLIMSRRKH